MHPWRVSLTTGSHLHHHGFHLKSLVVFKYHHWPRETTRGLGPSSSGQVRNCTVLSWSTTSLSRSVEACHWSITCQRSHRHKCEFGDAALRRWGVERAWVSHEMGWGVGIFDTLFSPHSSTLSRTFFFPRKFNLQGKRLIAVMTASVQMLPRVLVPWRKFQLRWDFGLSARRDVQMWDGGEAGQRLHGERKRRRHRRVTLG